MGKAFTCSQSAFPKPWPWKSGSSTTSQIVALNAWSEVALAMPISCRWPNFRTAFSFSSRGYVAPGNPTNADACFSNESASASSFPDSSSSPAPPLNPSRSSDSLSSKNRLATQNELSSAALTL